jgi:hypothetical protein
VLRVGRLDVGEAQGAARWGAIWSKALLVAGGPVVLLGGGHGLMIVVMLIAKPNFR